MTGSATMKLVAVTTNGSGIITDLSVEIQPGKGRILTATSPLIGTNTQNSERVAKEVAEKMTGISLDESDVIMTISSEAGTVDGPSAGAAMVVGIISAMTRKEINPLVLVTGTIDPDGTVGPVGGVLAKARAAAQAGAKVFLIPSGTKIQVEHVKTVDSPSPGVFVEQDQTVRTDIVKYGRENLGLDVREVSSINEVAREAFSGFNGTMPEVRIEEIPLVQENYSDAEAGIREIARRGLERAREAANSSGSSAFDKQLEEAGRLYAMNYFYSAANEAFLVAKDAKGTYYNLTQAKEEVAGKLSRMQEIISELNASDRIPIEEMSQLAAGEQRYLWARFYSDNLPEDLDSLLSASEWLSASEDILGQLDRGGAGEVSMPRASLQVKASQAMADASGKVAAAKSSGADTFLSERSLALAQFALSQGLPLPAIYDSIDAEAHAISESVEGTLPELVGYAMDLDANATDPWAINYLKHSEYLIHRASLIASREEARSAMFIAIRAIRVQDAFKVFPGTAISPREAGNETDEEGPSSGGFRDAGFAPRDVFVMILFSVSITLSVYSLYRLSAIERRLGPLPRSGDKEKKGRADESSGRRQWRLLVREGNRAARESGARAKGRRF